MYSDDNRLQFVLQVQNQKKGNGNKLQLEARASARIDADAFCAHKVNIAEPLPISVSMRIRHSSR